MPIHDWSRVRAGTFHHFHCAWITHLSESLNAGLLPDGYYAMSEQHFDQRVGDVLALRTPDDEGSFAAETETGAGGLALAETPPKVDRRVAASEETFYRKARRTLTIRHASGQRIVALVEILSPGNKDREKHLDEFVSKVESALRQGIHVLVVDLFPPGPRDPFGIHGAIWSRLDSFDAGPPADRPITSASYVAGLLPEAFVSQAALGDPLPEMPLFLQTDHYINAPLESTYQTAYRGIPFLYRDILEGRRPAEN